MSYEKEFKLSSMFKSLRRAMDLTHFCFNWQNCRAKLFLNDKYCNILENEFYTKNRDK